MKTFVLKPLVAAFVALSPCAPAMAQTAESSVVLTFEPGASTGAIMVVLFDSQAGYDGDRPVRVARIDVAAGAVSTTFDGLPVGDYAVKSFHDVNGDGQMNTNPFGMPIEPYAFSNNAVGNMGPASWDRARFAVSGETRQTISIR